MENKAILVALAASALGFALLQLYMRSFEADATGGEKLSIVVVTRDLLPGETLQRSVLAVRSLPQAYLESRHIRSSELDRVLGQKLALAAKANESLLWTDLESLAAPTRTLATLVQDGMRAVTVRAAQGSFGALLRPGDRVDVLLITRAEAAHAPTVAARTLLENVLVLAVGGQLGAPGEALGAGHGGDASQVAISVSTEQGRLVAQAETQGQLRLLLRNPDDIATTATNNTTTVAE